MAVPDCDPGRDGTRPDFVDQPAKENTTMDVANATQADVMNSLTCHFVPGLLPLGRATGRVTVYVGVEMCNGKTRVGFSHTQTGTYYRDGISWECKGHDLQIDFKFADADMLQAALVFGSVENGSPFKTQSCLVRSRAASEEPHFDVVVDGASLFNLGVIDPKIKITPYWNSSDGREPGPGGVEP